MKVPFDKMHGLGNDFVVIDDREGALDLDAAQVSAICDRHMGVGADGVILVRSSDREGCDGYMHYINADGTLAQMCGNGVRCFAKYLVDHGIVDASAGRLVADTLAGPRPITYELDADGRMATATVCMGSPVLTPADVPVAAESDATGPDGEPYVGSLRLDSPYGAFEFACVSMGNPHAVCFVDDWEALPGELFAEGQPKGLASFDVSRVGSFFEGCEAFPEKANIEFAALGPEGIGMRVFERGCGETLACGTGACATAVAAHLTGRAPREVRVSLLGGALAIDWRADGEVLMTGPAACSFTGTLEL